MAFRVCQCRRWIYQKIDTQCLKDYVIAASRPNITYAEQVLAAALIRANERFAYEPKEFRIHHPNGRTGGFRPDFYLPDRMLYIEVGNPRQKRRKLRIMRAAFPQVKIIVVANDWVEEIKGLFGDQVLTWLHERWIEQEFDEIEHITRRVEAREEALLSKRLAQIGPSLRTH